MKHLNQFITEYIIKKKLDKPIDSEYKYHPQTKEELIKNIKELLPALRINILTRKEKKKPLSENSSPMLSKMLSDLIL